MVFNLHLALAVFSHTRTSQSKLSSYSFSFLRVIMKNYNAEELLHKAAAYCSTTEHSISEVREKLQAWGANADEAKKIIGHLLKEDFINESRFASAFVRDKFRFNKWGKIKIALAIKAKGINDTLTQEALEVIDPEEYHEMLVSLLKAKRKSVKYNSQYERDGKLFRFAQSRGFEYQAIEKALQELD